MDKELEGYKIGLPKAINTKIVSHVELANAFNSILTFDLSEKDFPSDLRTYIPYFKSGVSRILSDIRSDISSMMKVFNLEMILSERHYKKPDCAEGYGSSAAKLDSY